MVLDEEGDGLPREYTRSIVRLLTPEHAAPEQIRGEPATTATDVYALGVLLFQLLTGRLPYAAERRRLPQLEHAILEEPAPAPSAIAPSAADARGLRGDLDRIVLMALRKEPERRYTSASQLADDVERFLAGRPVRAQPDTLRYRTRKFVARNRALVSAGVALMLMLGAFAATTALQAHRLAAERDRADDERETAEEVVATERWQRRDFANALALFEQALALLDSELPRDHPDRLIVASNVAASLGELGQWEGAARLTRELLDTQLERPNPDSTAIAATLQGWALQQANLGAFAEAERGVRAALAIQPRVMAPDHWRIDVTLLNLALIVARIVSARAWRCSTRPYRGPARAPAGSKT